MFINTYLDFLDCTVFLEKFRPFNFSCIKKRYYSIAFKELEHSYLMEFSVPTDLRSFRTGPKNILEDRSIQDLKITKRTFKDLFLDPGTIIRNFSK